MMRVILLLVCLGWASNLFSSKLAYCESGSSVSVNSIICNSNKTLDGKDDFITFNLNAQCSEGVTIHDFPFNTIISEQEKVVMAYGTYNNSIVIMQDGQYTVKIPSPSCQPINLKVQWSEMECQDGFLIVDSRVELPTLGQWGILILFISIFIIGYLEIKKTRQRPVYLRTSFQV